MRYDYLQMIEDLQGQGFTQAEIGDRIGWSLGQVKQHAALIKKIVTEVLALAKQHQEGRVTKKVTFVTFDFTEGWFRNSGIYDLDAGRQRSASA
jgi:hypothetical protein